MFLVMYRTNLDDLPVQLCATRQEAEEVKNGIEAVASGKSIGIKAEVVRRLFNVDKSELCNVTIVEFDETGHPKDVIIGDLLPKPSAKAFPARVRYGLSTR